MKKPKKPDGMAVAKATPAKVDVKPRTKTRPEETMDRAALKEIVTQLKAAGADVKVFKTDTDEMLQRKVSDALQKLPSDEVMRKLESIDPNKLASVLGRGCLGIFVDLSDVSCVRCADAVACVTAFTRNVKNMPDLTKVMTDEVKPKVAAPVPPAPATRYDPGRLVFVRDVKNPNKRGDDLYDTIQRVLDEQPENLLELRKIVEQDFDLDSDGDFMKFVTAMRNPKEGIIKMDVDLSESDKAALRKAGYDV